MKAFEEFRWEDPDIPTPTLTASVRTASSASTKQSGSSRSITTLTSSLSSAKPTSSAGPVQQYAIVSKQGTSTEVFKKFMQEIDGGKGIFEDLPGLRTHFYLTDLNATQASVIKKSYDFLEDVSPNVIDESVDGSLEHFRAIDQRQLNSSIYREDHSFDSKRSQHDQKRSSEPIILRRELIEDASAPWWKRMLSADPRNINQPNSDPTHDPTYLADDSKGRGTTIYVLDDGFDLKLDVGVLSNRFGTS